MLITLVISIAATILNRTLSYLSIILENLSSSISMNISNSFTVNTPQKDTLTLVIAVIGAITGVIGLCLQFFYYRRFLPKVIFKIQDKSFIITKVYGYTPTLDDNLNYIISDDNDPRDCFIAEYIILSYMISNTSAYPIDLIKVSAKQDDKNNKWKASSNSNEIAQVFDPNISKNIVKLNPCAVIPLRLEPYETVNICLHFPYSRLIKKPLKLKFETSRKTYILKANPISYFNYKSKNSI